ADDQNRISLLNAFDRGIEKIAGAPELRIELLARLLAVQGCRAKATEQVLEREHFLGACEIACNGANLFGPSGFEPLGDHGQRLIPARGHEPPAFANVRLIEPLDLEAVRYVPRLVRN